MAKAVFLVLAVFVFVLPWLLSWARGSGIDIRVIALGGIFMALIGMVALLSWWGGRKP